MKSQFWKRTGQVIARQTMAAIRMEGADIPSRLPRTLFTMNSLEDIQNFKTGCDADHGGKSSVKLVLDQSTVDLPLIGRPTAKFSGDMRLDVKPDSRLPRGGYAAFNSRDRTSLFGTITDSLDFHKYLALRVRVGGDSITHDAYFVNCLIQEPFETDLWQHRLYFKRPNEWEDIFLPFSNFVMTKGGHPQETQFRMGNDLSSVGIALLGGHSNVSGRYELNIDSFSIVNEEDAKSSLVHDPPHQPMDPAWEKL